MLSRTLNWLQEPGAQRINGLLLLAIAAFLAWASLTGRVARCIAPRYYWLPKQRTLPEKL